MWSLFTVRLPPLLTPIYDFRGEGMHCPLVGQTQLYTGVPVRYVVSCWRVRMLYKDGFFCPLFSQQLDMFCPFYNSIAFHVCYTFSSAWSCKLLLGMNLCWWTVGDYILQVYKIGTREHHIHSSRVICWISLRVSLIQVWYIFEKSISPPCCNWHVHAYTKGDNNEFIWSCWLFIFFHSALVW